LTSLQWLTRDGLSLDTVSEPAAHSGINLTADERHALVNIVRATDQSVWYSDLLRKTSIRVGSEGVTSFSPVSTKDGSLFVFTNIRGTRSELVRRSAGATGIEVLRSDVTPLLALDLTPDNRYLLFAEWKKMNNPNLWALTFSEAGLSAGEPIPVATSAYSESTGQFSPDGRFVVYVSDETARDEIYVQSFPQPRLRTRISTAGGRYPRWRSPAEILYLGLDGTLFSISVQATAAGVFAGAPKALFPLRRLGFGTSHAYDVTRDGRRILALQPLARSGEEAFTIRQNWQPKR
jgi:hypothetical protein